MSARGEIKSPKFAKTLVDFSGVRYKKITPTDVDVLIEYQNRVYILAEIKYKNANIPFGQELALERMADDLAKIKPTLLIHCNWESLINERIDLSSTNVVRYRSEGKWVFPAKKLDFKELADRFLVHFGGYDEVV